MAMYRTILTSIACLLMLGGCTSYSLMPTPNIYAAESGYPEDQVPEALRSNQVDLLYVTDRSPESDENGKLAYGSERSDSIAFGSVVVEFGDCDVSGCHQCSGRRLLDGIQHRRPLQMGQYVALAAGY